jgi:CheY-like chemotaxis protein
MLGPPLQSRIVAGDEIVGRSFIDSFEHTPVVLMSSCSTSEDVMRAVKLGAVDFLDKPLSHLKLKNIWQHSVRKVRASQAGTATDPSAPQSFGCVQCLALLAAFVLLEACKGCSAGAAARRSLCRCVLTAPAHTCR